MLHRILTYIKLSDKHDETISLTAIALLCAVFAYLFLATWQSVAGLAIISALYAHKRWLGYVYSRRTNEYTALETRLSGVEALKAHVVRLANKLGVSL